MRSPGPVALLQYARLMNGTCKRCGRILPHPDSGGGSPLRPRRPSLHGSTEPRAWVEVTTLGSQSVQDVYKTALVVVAAFKGDPVRDELHPDQVQALDDLEAACRFVFDLAAIQHRESA